MVIDVPPPQELLRRADRARPLLGALSEAQAHEIIEELWRRQEARRRPRERRSYGRPQPRCSVCHLFKATPSGVCGSCGYEPGRGFRE